MNYAGSADPLSWIRPSLQAGYNAGAWNGKATSAGGVITTSAGGNLYGIGYTDSADGTGIDSVPNTVELKYTVMGDANLDGTVNLADLLALTRHFGQTGGWDSGDVNYDGAINLSDFLTLTRHFAQSLPPTLSAGDLLLPASPHPDRLAARRVRQ